MTVPFRHPHRVSYAECTLGNHVYHSRYLDWLEAARGEFVRSLGSTVLQWQERDVIFPVIEARLRYKSPARYDDLLAIEVWPALIERVAEVIFAETDARYRVAAAVTLLTVGGPR